jgi:hypothetical protein
MDRIQEADLRVLMRTLFILTLVVLATRPAAAQQAKPITIGIYAPTVEFGSASARLSYVQGLAKAIESATGQSVTASSYASFSALEKDGVDFAVIEAQCYATNGKGKLIATAVVGGGGSRQWALYSTVADMTALSGKKLAYVQTGCNDTGFVDNAMLDSEVDSGFFGTRVGKSELTSAVAEVASYKTAQAVFAPSGAAKGLTKLFDTVTVPNPAFVALSSRVSSELSNEIASAVLGYKGGGAITGWQKPSKESYTTLNGRMKRTAKQSMFAAPQPVRIDASDVLVDPPTMQEPARPKLRHLFVRPSDNRMN